jgi:hypothetical protein
VAAAHASLACYLKLKEVPEVEQQLVRPLFKAVCRVSVQEFEAAKACPE